MNEVDDSESSNGKLPDLQKKKGLFNAVRFIVIIIFVLWLGAIGAFILLNFKFPIIDLTIVHLALISVFCFIVFLFLIGIISLRINGLNTEIELAKRWEEIRSIPPDMPEKKAEIIFELTQYEIKNCYYNNIAQGRRANHLALIPIMMGFLVLSMSIYLLSTNERYNSETIFALGAIGAILFGLIASIYLRISSEFAKSSNKFLGSMGTTNNLLSSDFIASKIRDVNLREKTYSNMAKNFAGQGQTIDDENAD